jgi:hypothetical protein
LLPIQFAEAAFAEAVKGVHAAQLHFHLCTLLSKITIKIVSNESLHQGTPPVIKKRHQCGFRDNPLLSISTTEIDFQPKLARNSQFLV